MTLRLGASATPWIVNAGSPNRWLSARFSKHSRPPEPPPPSNVFMMTMFTPGSSRQSPQFCTTFDAS